MDVRIVISHHENEMNYVLTLTELMNIGSKSKKFSQIIYEMEKSILNDSETDGERK